MEDNPHMILFRNGIESSRFDASWLDWVFKVVKVVRQSGAVVRLEWHSGTEVEYLSDTGDFVKEWTELQPIEEPAPKPKRIPSGKPPGRPKSNEVRILKSIMLTDVEIAKAQAAGNGNLSAGIRKAIGLLD